jgi:hypothetical protein
MEELIYKCLSLYTPLLVRGKSIKPSHEITSIKATLIQVCDKGMKHISILTLIKKSNSGLFVKVNISNKSWIR